MWRKLRTLHSEPLSLRGPDAKTKQRKRTCCPLRVIRGPYLSFDAGISRPNQQAPRTWVPTSAILRCSESLGTEHEGPIGSAVFVLGHGDADRGYLGTQQVLPMARASLPAGHGFAERILPGGDVLRGELRMKAGALRALHRF